MRLEPTSRLPNSFGDLMVCHVLRQPKDQNTQAWLANQLHIAEPTLSKYLRPGQPSFMPRDLILKTGTLYSLTANQVDALLIAAKAKLELLSPKRAKRANPYPLLSPEERTSFPVSQPSHDQVSSGEATMQYQEALRLSPTDTSARTALISLLIETKRPFEALDVAEEWTTLDPANEAAWAHKWQVLIHLFDTKHIAEEEGTYCPIDMPKILQGLYDCERHLPGLFDNIPDDEEFKCELQEIHDQVLQSWGMHRRFNSLILQQQIW
jgi:hypothetical protein